jgi:hypothetical protein
MSIYLNICIMMSLGDILHLNEIIKPLSGRFPVSLWLLANSAFMRNFGEVSRAQEISCCDKNQTLKWDGPPKLPKCIQPPQLRAVICNISPFNRRLSTHQQSILRSIEDTPQPFRYQYALNRIFIRLARPRQRIVISSGLHLGQLILLTDAPVF